MSLCDIKIQGLVILNLKQTDVSAECEDSIQFADNDTSITINGSDVYIYNYN